MPPALQADPTVQSGPTAGTVGTDVTITVTIAPPNTYGLRKWGTGCACLLLVEHQPEWTCALPALLSGTQAAGQPCCAPPPPLTFQP